ncbi:MAG TPA: DUF4249 family protein [Longimicrobiales bacterium]|nr:DUF4249 family protein [Longimicrobiales bacterium]
MGVLSLWQRAGTRAAVVTAALSAAGCQIPSVPDPIIEDQDIVYGVLRVGSPTVEVVIEEWPAGGGFLSVPGATVSVTGLGQTTQLVEAAADGLCQVTFDGDFVLARPGCYTATLPQPVAPLETYTLDIRLPGGGVVTAQTTTPAPPDFRTTTDTLVALYTQTPDNFPIAIAPTEVLDAPGATRVDVAFSVAAGVDEPESCVPDAHVDPYLSPALVGSHDFYFWGLRCLDQPTPWDVLDLLLHAAAYDANYAAYLRTALEGNAFSSADGTFGMSGAVGVFGSAAITTVPLVLAYRPEQLFPSDRRYALR